MTGGATAGPTRVPLFPLPLVLFPGTQLPLHIFEPRYRAMLADVRAADGRFGIILRTSEDERAIPAGHVGCYAQVREVVPLVDGRSNVLVDGRERFAVERLIEAGLPYHVGLVRTVDDDESDPAALRAAADRVRAAFARVTRAARTLADETFADRPAGTTTLATDPAATVASDTTAVLSDRDAAVAFTVAGVVELDLSTRQRVLASTNPVERTEYVAHLLERALPDLEARAGVHVRARSNGHGPHDPPSGTP